MYIRYDLSDSHNPRFDLILLFIVFTNGKCGICLSVCSNELLWINYVLVITTSFIQPYRIIFKFYFGWTLTKFSTRLRTWSMIKDLWCMKATKHRGGGAAVLHKYWCVEKTSVHSLWLFRFRFSPIALLNKPTMVHIWARGYVHGRASSCPHQH